LNTTREPIFNVPGVVFGALALIGIIHAVMAFVLSDEAATHVLVLFAFIPARYGGSAFAPDMFPGGIAAQIWSPVSYALFHSDLTHLIFNSVWLLAFGTPVARRFGALRFGLFLMVTAAAGAAAHLVTHVGQLAPMIGASASVSGCMAAAMRFAFQRGGPLTFWRRDDDDAYRMPAAPLLASLRDPRVFAFLVVWFGLNILFGLGSIPMPGAEQAVAWQAHIGGFLLGLLAFALFDPVPRPDVTAEHDGRPQI
jgi:membrane associated rhomboid family serine protease